MNKLPIILVSALAAFCLLSGCRAEKRAESAVSTVSETGNTEPSLAENAVTAPAEPFFFEGTCRPDEAMPIDVTEWNADGAPETFCVTYDLAGKGYRVFFQRTTNAE